MKRKTNHSDPLDRLLRGAALANEVNDPIPGLSWASENRVLGAWRTARSGGIGESWMGLFRAGVALAGATALLTVVITWHTDVTPAADEVAVTDAAFNVAVLR
jgi:hypothetical protein